MIGVWLGLAGMSAVAAWVDARRQEIPNRLSLVAAGVGGVLLVLHILPWTRLLWAAATWGLYEIVLWRQPEALGWGDVKWATVIMGYLGGSGLLVLFLADALRLVWSTVRWWRHGRQGRWRDAGAPWAPGAFVGVLVWGLWPWH